ncbi:MAG: Gfo/Idh/MocA family oxidoreductase [Candidatus Riflebacteria bacterium]|nr:Gfo/Idh/MocA family oxidoreductase [Candidatus Riflebacteria bacterium]
MNILAGNRWSSGFLDYCRSDSDYRIEVYAMKNLQKIEGMYFIRRNSIRMVFNYLFEVGLKHLIRKIRSRMGEKLRNEKYISAGIGRILEAPSDGKLCKNDIVFFLAPFHPACSERIVLPEFLVQPWTNMLPFNRKDSEIRYLKNASEPSSEYWNKLTGFSTFSGTLHPKEIIQKCMADAESDILSTDWCKAEKFTSSNSEISENTDIKAVSKDRPKGIVFGYGNYAKSFLIPNVSPFIDIKCIHEVDPTQIPLNSEKSIDWNTSPFPGPSEKADAFFIASYHHTHIPIALSALKQGAYSVIEKPIAVDENQLKELLKQLKISGPRLFSCFHKRYQHFNPMIAEDLSIGKGQPVSFHCIVYEVPLPELHWYWWPNSKSRIVSNGCHWIDYFLFWNNFSKPLWHDLSIGSDGTVNASAELENGAFFSMLLTDRGSERIGLRDYIELRTNNKTAKIIDGGTYSSEDSGNLIRKASVNKLSSYENMYSTIAEKVSRGIDGDSIESVETSAGLILAFERTYQTKKRGVLQ